MWAECLAKAEGCWKSGCFLGRCLACPLKVKLGAPGRCPERRKAGVAPALGFEWSPLLSQSLFLSGLFTQPTTAGWCRGGGSDHPCCLSPVVLREGSAGHSSFWKSKISLSHTRHSPPFSPLPPTPSHLSAQRYMSFLTHLLASTSTHSDLLCFFIVVNYVSH